MAKKKATSRKAATKKAPRKKSAKKKAVKKRDATKNSVGMEMKLIPPGTFTMGENDPSRSTSEAHQVTLTQPFELGVGLRLS